MRIILASLAAFLVTPLQAQMPTNDLFRDRIQLTGTNEVATASNVSATKEPGEPNHADNPGGKSLWWTWTAPISGDLTVTTDGSEFDTILGVYTGTSVSTLSLVATNDDHGYGYTSRVRFQATAGIDYQIAVDGYSDGTNVASGNVLLSLLFLPEPILRPANDNFREATQLSDGSVSVAGSNLHATHEGGEASHAGRLGDASVWWSWVAESSQKVRITTAGSSFDTLLGVYTGSSISNLAKMAANDDEDPEHGVLTSAVSFDTVAGQTFAIVVDGYDGAMGDIVLSLGPGDLRLSNPVLENNTFRVTLQSVRGRVYYLEYNDSVANTNWTRLPGLPGNGSLLVLTNTALPSPLRFYRAAIE